MKIENAYSGIGNNIFEKIVKNNVEYIRVINTEKLIEYSHEKVDASFNKGHIEVIGKYMEKNSKDYPYLIVDLSHNIALSKVEPSEFNILVNKAIEDYKTHKDYDRYSMEHERIGRENLFNILVYEEGTGLGANEPIVGNDKTKALISSLGLNFMSQEYTISGLSNIFLNSTNILNALKEVF